jgi:hypothetical protein
MLRSRLQCGVVNDPSAGFAVAVKAMKDTMLGWADTDGDDLAASSLDDLCLRLVFATVSAMFLHEPLDPDNMADVFSVPHAFPLVGQCRLTVSIPELKAPMVESAA